MQPKDAPESFALMYHGTRHENGTVTVLAGSKELTPDASLKVRNHSPDGFNWAIAGAGRHNWRSRFCST